MIPFQNIKFFFFFVYTKQQQQKTKNQQLAIDIDVQEIEQLLNDNQMDAAMDLYRRGGNTRPYAELQLLNELTETIDISTTVYVNTGDTTKDYRIYGTTMNALNKGKKSIQILYDINSNPTVQCKVGAKPLPILDGCK